MDQHCCDVQPRSVSFLSISHKLSLLASQLAEPSLTLLSSCREKRGHRAPQASFHMSILLFPLRCQQFSTIRKPEARDEAPSHSCARKRRVMTLMSKLSRSSFVTWSVCAFSNQIMSFPHPPQRAFLVWARSLCVSPCTKRF